MGRQKANIHYLYKTTCNVTGRYYIGMHSTTNLEDGYLGSGKRLRYSIRKYGEDNHETQILEFFDSRELLVEAEKKAITEDMIADNNCMNLKSGGTGGLNGLSKDIITKISKAGKCAFLLKLQSDEKFRDDWREKISNTLKETYKNDKTLKRGRGAFFLNKKHSKETKQLLSSIRKNNGIGKNNSQYGTCWITNEKESIKIIIGDEIPNGWRLGRKLKIVQ